MRGQSREVFIAGTITIILIYFAHSLSRSRQRWERELSKVPALVPGEASHSGRADLHPNAEDEEAERRALAEEIQSLRRENERLRPVVSDRAEGDNARQVAVENLRLRQELVDTEEAAILQRSSLMKELGLSAIMFADHHDGRFPADLAQATTFMDPTSARTLQNGDYEFFNVETLRQITNPATTMLAREKPRSTGMPGALSQVIIFADGHTETRRLTNEVFAP